MRSHKWRRFLPRRKLQPVAVHDDIFADAWQQVESMRLATYDDIQEVIDRSNEPTRAVDWLVLLLLRSPAAARAQESMDEHPHDHRQHHKRLYELIDFNDAFVSTVLMLTESQRREFSAQIQQYIVRICRQVHVKPFSDEQFEAITHGLSREIAVYQAANTRNFHTDMTTRDVDAFGVDMRITDEVTGRYINVDCKTRSSFHFRLKDLVRDHRLTQEEMDHAEEAGYCSVIHRRDELEVEIILLRVGEDDFGQISNFRFVDEQRLARRLMSIIEKEGVSTGARQKNYSITA